MFLVRYKQDGEWYSAKFETKRAAEEFADKQEVFECVENHGEL